MLNKNKNDGIDLIKLFFVLVDHWKLLLVSTILVGVIAYTQSKYLTTPLYQSTSKLYVVSKTISATNISAALQLGSNLTDDYIEVIKGRPIIDQVIKNLDLNTSYYGLVGKIAINNPTNSRILTITVTDTSPQRAKQIADEMAVVSAAYISEKMDQDPPSVLQYGYVDGGQINNTVKSDTRRGCTIGACIAVAFILLMYFLRDTVSVEDDVEKKLGLNLLGTLPLEDDIDGKKKQKNKSNNTVKKQCRSVSDFSYARKESLRGLKTNIQFCGDDVKVIMFTSSLPDEGKSTVTYDLALSLTDSGKKVLFVDTDMRGSVMYKYIHVQPKSGSKLVGLAHYLSGQNTLDEVIYDTKIPNFSIILSGPRTPNATEILEKPYFQKMIDYGRENYDYVLIDCAPMAAVIDAAIVAKYCDGAVLVVAQDVANSRLILNSKKQLEVAKITILGVVLNKFKVDKHHYGKYYGRYYGSYYGGQYGHEEDKEEHFNW